ncbi:MAG: fumarylacetoacetate hydrolase family protein [Chloroflexi bacterium]|nr:fumarylacetoacetate hydrolase family protein [Chloroflexota bacterium]
MRIVRFVARGKAKYGLLEKNVIHGLRGSPFTHFKHLSSPSILDGSIYKPDEVRLLAPCLPSKIVCLGLNYRSHVEELKLPLPSVPLIFLKPSTAVIGPDDKIILPHNRKRIDYEGELGVVIGKQANDVPEEEAMEYILGYTCFNDVSDRHAQAEDGQWTRAKGYDTFAPIGPWIETEANPDNLKLETYLNGELRQSASTNDLIFGVSKLISFISAVMTLLPDDVIATGTPSGIGPISPGDVVEIRIEKIGTLRNPVIAQE